MITKERLNVYLYKMLGSDELVEAWWNSPNKYWDGRTPTLVYKTDPDSVFRYILYWIQK